MKEVPSSENDSALLPLTPASTPVSTNEKMCSRTSPVRRELENASASQAAQEPKRVTIGVNTGASLLWEYPKDNTSSFEKCSDNNR